MNPMGRFEEEMAKFEHEIARPPMRPPAPNIALQFVPHAIHRPIHQMGPPVPPRGAFGGLPMPAMPTVPTGAPPPPFIPMSRGGLPMGANMPRMPVPLGAQGGFGRPPAPPRPPPPAPAPAPAPVTSVSVSEGSGGGGAVIEAGPTKYLAPGAVASAGGSTKTKQPTTSAPVKTVMVPSSQSSRGTYSTVTAESGGPGPSSSRISQVVAGDFEAVQARKRDEAAYKNSYIGQVLAGKKKPKRFVRAGGGQVWEDPTLGEWDTSDFRLFCGDLGNEVSDEILAKTFSRYPSFQKAKVVREKKNNKTKGYGFVSFKDPNDMIKAMREVDGKYVGNRPIKLRKSTWKERNIEVVKKKVKEKHKIGLKS